MLCRAEGELAFGGTGFGNGLLQGHWSSRILELQAIGGQPSINGGPLVLGHLFFQLCQL